MPMRRFTLYQLDPLDRVHYTFQKWVGHREEIPEGWLIYESEELPNLCTVPRTRTNVDEHEERYPKRKGYTEKNPRELANNAPPAEDAGRRTYAKLGKTCKGFNHPHFLNDNTH